MADDPNASSITLPDVYVTPEPKPASSLTAATGGSNQPGLSATDSFNMAVGGALDLGNMPSQIAPLDQVSAFRIGQHSGLDDPPTPPMAPVTGKMPDVQPATLPAPMRYDFGQQLLQGDTPDPQTFAEKLVGKTWGRVADSAPDAEWSGNAAQLTNAARSIAAGLPDHDSLNTYGAYISNDVYGGASPASVNLVKGNLLDVWASTGVSPDALVRQADKDPAFKQALATPQQPPPHEALSDEERDGVSQPIVKPEDWSKLSGVVTPETANALQGFMPFKAPPPMVEPHVDTTKTNQGKAPPEPMEVADLGHGVGWASTPVPKTPEQSERELYEASGIPDITGAYQALKRGETLQAIGQGGAGAYNLASLIGPAKGTGELGMAAMGLGTRIAGGLYRSHFMSPAALAAWTEKQTGKHLALNTIQAETGAAARDKAIASASMEQYRKLLAPLWKGHQDWIDQTQAYAKQVAAAKAQWIANGGNPAAFSMQSVTGQVPTLDPIMTFIDHVQDRPGGGRLHPDSPLRAVADAMKDITDADWQGMLAAGADPNSYNEAYYKQFWKDPRAFDRAFNYGAGRQGSGSAFQKRTIPYYYDGITRGLTPRILDPIDNMLYGHAAVQDYLAAKRILETGKAKGQVYYDARPRGPDDVRLDGLMARKTAAFENKAGDPEARVYDAYAAPGWAKVYNRWLAPGMERWPIVGAVYPKLQAFANGMIGSVLGFSGYHYWNMAQETGASGLTNALGEFANGDLARAVKQIGLSAPIAPKVVENLAAGARLQNAYLRRSGTPVERQLADVMQQVNIQPLSRGENYFIGQTRNIFKSMQQGSIRYEIAQDARSVFGSANETTAARAALTVPRMTAMAAHWFGRVANTMSAPLFDYAIPKLKVAAWADEMEAFMRAHPQAAEEEILTHARTIRDSMDDRFGELNLDNLNWPKLAKQAANLGLVSVGWEYGTLRAFSRGLDDATNGEFSTRARWLMAFPMMMAIQSTAYQALRGQGLPTSITDLYAPRTGGYVGSHTGSAPERALLPGPQKEAMQWYLLARATGNFADFWKGVASYGLNKQSPVVRTVEDFFTSKDFGDLYNHLVATNAPIASQYAPKQGSQIGHGQNFLGIRPTFFGINQPEAFDAWIKKQHMDADRTAAWKDYYHDQELERPTGVPKPNGNQFAPAGRSSRNPGQ